MESFWGLLNALSSVWQRLTRLARWPLILMLIGPVLGVAFSLLGQKEISAVVFLVPPLVAVPLFLYSLRTPQNFVAIGSLLGVMALPGTGRIPGNREAVFRAVGRLLAWYFAAVSIAAVYGYFVPVGNRPALAIPLVGALLAAILVRISGWSVWVSNVFALIALGVTVAFFFAGEEAKAEAQLAQQAVEALRVEEFKVNAGEEVFTRLVGPGTLDRVRGDKPWIALSRDDQGTYKRPDGNYRLENYGAGRQIIWRGGAPEGPLLVKGLMDGTIIQFERIERR